MFWKIVTSQFTVLKLTLTNLWSWWVFRVKQENLSCIRMTSQPKVASFRINFNIVTEGTHSYWLEGIISGYINKHITHLNLSLMKTVTNLTKSHSSLREPYFMNLLLLISHLIKIMCFLQVKQQQQLVVAAALCQNNCNVKQMVT